jgi:hypothetical protein
LRGKTNDRDILKFDGTSISYYENGNKKNFKLCRFTLENGFNGMKMAHYSLEKNILMIRKKRENKSILGSK